MPSGLATVTAPIGPGRTATALVLSAIQNINFDTRRGVLSIQDGNSKWTDFDCNATTTITATAASGVFTFTVSQ